MKLRNKSPSNYLADALDNALESVAPIETRGRVLEAVGTLIKVTGVEARVGDLCELRSPNGNWRMRAEVVGVARQTVLLMPYGELEGISAQTEVVNIGKPPSIKVGEAVLGRVLNGFGEPMDHEGPVNSLIEYPLRAPAPDPLSRKRVARVLQTGVRAIDGLLTCGEGQRVGIFASAGTGKSSLMAMIARGTMADVTVVGLIGERGREVGEFLHAVMPPERRNQTVCVVVTSDRPAVERAKAPNTATAIAEYFRDQGKSVLLLVDSVTRYARALREIGLAAGEPPTRRGYPPSVFTALPRLFERAGQSEHGSITAFYTVLVDDDESGDPMGEEVRSILDGHIVLSPELASSGHYPAIDVMLSRSRVMTNVVNSKQRQVASEICELIAKYKSIETLIQIGEYKPGTDARADKAMRCRDAIQSFLRQEVTEPSPYELTVAQLQSVVNS